MKNKFCSNKANCNKNSFNSQYESTKDLFATALEYEAKFLSLNYDNISLESNEHAFCIARDFLDNRTTTVDSTSDSSESGKNFGFERNDSIEYESFHRSFYRSNNKSLLSRGNSSLCENSFGCDYY